MDWFLRESHWKGFSRLPGGVCGFALYKLEEGWFLCRSSRERKRSLAMWHLPPDCYEVHMTICLLGSQENPPPSGSFEFESRLTHWDLGRFENEAPSHPVGTLPWGLLPVICPWYPHGLQGDFSTRAGRYQQKWYRQNWCQFFILGVDGEEPGTPKWWWRRAKLPGAFNVWWHDRSSLCAQWLCCGWWARWRIMEPNGTLKTDSFVVL